jgi:hypothetical protein
MKEKTHLDELARRLCAAVVSERAGLSGVDYTLKRQVEPPGDFYYELAELVWSRVCADQPRPFGKMET